jgi:hypothetical protein
MLALYNNRQDSLMLDGPKSVLPLTHFLERSMSMLNLHKLKLLHNLKPRLLLFSIMAFLVFAGPAVTLPGHSRASNGLALPASGPLAKSAEPVQTSCLPTDRSIVGEFGPVTYLPLVPVHLSVLPDGRVLFWGRDKNIVNGSVKDVAGKSEAYVWNISDGSDKTDVAVYRPSESKWYIINSSTGAARFVPFGINGDVPVPGDYDGDGRADLAVFRPSEGNWYIMNSSTGATVSILLGGFTDIVTPGDYDGDGKTDAAVFRPSEGNWYIRQSSDGLTLTKSWGINGDVPVPKDYDLDRKTDVAVYRPSDGFWRILNSSSTNGTAQIILFGASGDIPVPGDYSGDGRADLAVFRPSEGNWRIRNIQTGSNQVITWGLSTDVVTPGDYDGDGKTDAAIFRPSEGNWYIRNSSDGSFQVKTWGINGDIMVPEDYDGMLRVPNSTTNLFCSGHSFLPDGRLFVAGGHKSPDTDRAGEEDTNIFNYNTNRWSAGPPMSQGRWYPYNVTLSTGETLIMAGDYWANEPATNPRVFATNLVPQVYTSGGTLRNLTEPPPPSLTLYPYLHLTPNGKVFQAQSGFVIPSDPSTLSKDSRLLDPDANQGSGAWTNLVSTIFPHAMGTSVLFDSGRKAMIVGGFDNMKNPTKEAEFIDLTLTGQPFWTQLASMNSARTYHTATILPDGKVLVSGGVSCQGGNNIDCLDAAAMAPEMWDPMANPTNPALTPWRKMAAQKEVRAYHSLAALLPDGRVLIGGGGLPGAAGESDANNQRINRGDESYAKVFGHKNVEIYSPPYLFDSNGCVAVRPTITSAPASVSYGQTFFVGTSGAGTGAKVSLVRLASVTHGFNQDQRHAFLTATPSGSSGLNVTAPADAHKAPPGYYMLFVLKSNGVPSVAKIVRVLGTAAYEGNLDAADCGQIAGWAWNRSTPNKPINVDIYADGVKIATVAANLFRQDLLNGDKGNGFHGFVFTPPQSLMNGQIRSITVRFGGTSSNLSFSPRSIACNVSLFPTQLPDSWTSGAGATWEQATQFSSTMSGKITHIRFYKDSKETGSHVGRIWSDTGAPLTPPLTFTGETASGWQTQALPTPLSITAGVRYRVSYNINFYTAKTFAGLNTPITNPNSPLTAHTSYYSTPAGTFPTTNSGSILFADVVFKAP